MNPQEQTVEPIVQQTHSEAKNKKNVAIIIILAILTIIGVGFGIYGMARLNDVGKTSNKNNSPGQNDVHTSEIDMDDLIVEDGDRLIVTYPYHKYNTLQSSSAFFDNINRFEQAMDLGPDDIMSSATVELTNSDDSTDDNLLTFSIENGKIKITNKDGNEYIVEKFNDIVGIIEAKEEFITVINSQNEIYYSIIDRPIVWSTEMVDAYHSNGYELCPYEPYTSKLEEFENTFIDDYPIAFGIKKVPIAGSYALSGAIEYVYKMSSGTDLNDASDYVTFSPSCHR